MAGQMEREVFNFVAEHFAGAHHLALAHHVEVGHEHGVQVLSRGLVRAGAAVGLENVPLWHERDISHSSAERVVIPDSFLALDYMLNKAAWLVGGLVVHADRMRENLEASGGLVFSQRLLLALVSSGCERDEAYRLVQRNAAAAWDGGVAFRSLIEQDDEVTSRLPASALKEAFDLERSLEHVSVIFERLAALAETKEVGVRV